MAHSIALNQDSMGEAKRCFRYVGVRWPHLDSWIEIKGTQLNDAILIVIYESWPSITSKKAIR